MKNVLLGFIVIGLLTFIGCEKEKQKGCTEPNAINFDSAAEENDGSCRYEDDSDNNGNMSADSTGTNNVGGSTDTDSTDTAVGDGATNNNGVTDRDSTGTSVGDGTTNNNGDISSDSTEIVISLPTLSTTTISSVTEISAVSGGNIINNGGGSITSRGICWGTNPNPTPADNSSVNGSGAGSFTSNLSGLTGGTAYFVRAYAINSAGTSYGNEVSFTTSASSSSIIDADGNVYTSVTIGTQEWMTENLRASKYSDGSAIPNVTNYSQWENLSTGAWSHYDNDSQYKTAYGKLYNWYAVSDPRNVCPKGWHIPTDAEWTVLTDYLALDGRSGTALKATSGWSDYDGKNGSGTDNYGWNGLPGGARVSDDYFVAIDSVGAWWSSVKLDTDSAWFRALGHQNGDVYREYLNKESGFSVRCLRD